MEKLNNPYLCTVTPLNFDFRLNKFLITLALFMNIFLLETSRKALSIFIKLGTL